MSKLGKSRKTFSQRLFWTSLFSVLCLLMSETVDIKRVGDGKEGGVETTPLSDDEKENLNRNVKFSGRWTKSYESNWPMSSFTMELWPLSLEPANLKGKEKKEKENLIIDFGDCYSPLSFTTSREVSTINPTAREACSFVIEIFINDISERKETINNNNTQIIIDLSSFHSKDFLQKQNLEEALFVKIVKITEAYYQPLSDPGSTGIMKLQKISLNSKKFQLLSPSLQGKEKQKFLVFGDSFTCGFGVLGNNEGGGSCSTFLDVESASKSWASITSDFLNLDMTMIAYSGKGVVRNYNDPEAISVLPLPAYYNRTLADDPQSNWDPTAFQADLILVMLGTNDYSTVPYPSDESFIDGYVDFVKRIQTDYPLSFIALLSPPGLDETNKTSNIEKVASLTKVHFLHVEKPFPLHGCLSHPNQEEQLTMAREYVIPFLNTFFFLNKGEVEDEKKGEG